MASPANSQSNHPFTASYGTMRSQPKAMSMQAFLLGNANPFFDPRENAYMVVNSKYRFEVTKEGPILSDKPLEELNKAWCLFQGTDGTWYIIYMRRNNGKMKCFTQGINNIPKQLHGQLMLLGISL